LSGLANNVPRLQRRPPRSLDGMRAATAQAQPKTKIQHPQQLVAEKSVAKPAKKPRKKAAKLQTPLLVLAIVVGGFLIQQSVAVGELCIVVYAAITLKQRIASRLTFILALVAFVGVLVMLLFQANEALAKNFALYSFLLLAVGVLSLVRELFSERHALPKRR
jgi:uncharacterized membrane protein YcjF (UPF0283 family)